MSLQGAVQPGHFRAFRGRLFLTAHLTGQRIPSFSRSSDSRSLMRARPRAAAANVSLFVKQHPFCSLSLATGSSAVIWPTPSKTNRTSLWSALGVFGYYDLVSSLKAVLGPNWPVGGWSLHTAKNGSDGPFSWNGCDNSQLGMRSSVGYWYPAVNLYSAPDTDPSLLSFLLFSLKIKLQTVAAVKAPRCLQVQQCVH